MSRAPQVFTADGIDQVGGILDDLFQSIEIGFKETDYTAPLVHSISTLEEQHAVMYDSGVDSNGEPWPPLSPTTIKKKGHDTILVDKQKMKASLIGPTGDSVRDIVEEGGIAGAVFGTDVEYAHFHVTGTPIMPARPPVGISENTIDLVCNDVADHTVASMTG